MLLKDSPSLGRLVIANCGHAGTGKTLSIGTIPASQRPILILDIDKGVASIMNHKVKGYDTSNIYVEQPLNWNEIDVFLARIENDRFLMQGTEKIFPKTVVFDGITRAQYTLKKAKFDANPKGGLQVWGMIIDTLEFTMHRFADMGINIIANFHMEEVKDDTTGMIVSRPLIYGKQLPRAVATWFDVFLTSGNKIPLPGMTGETEFYWITAATERWVARNRMNLPTTMPQDYAMLFEAANIK